MATRLQDGFPLESVFVHSGKARHRTACKILFGAIIFTALILLGLVVYSIVHRHAEVRGSAGPLFRSAPGKDPGPLMMRPDKAP